MKLEEIVGYLPHGLTGTAKEYDGTQYFAELTGIFKDCGEISFMDIDEVEGLLDNQSPTYHRGFLVDFKPILKTELSEQEKHILGGLVNPYDSGNLALLAEGFIEGYGADGCATPEAIKAVQYLYSIHYDIHGLIERGEAIDEKTIK